MKLKYTVITFLLLINISCITQDKRVEPGVNAKESLGKIISNAPKGIVKYDSVFKKPQYINLLEVYDQSCDLNLHVYDSTEEVVSSALFFKDSINTNRILTIEIIKMKSRQEAERVYTIIRPKVQELAKLSRRDRGKFCVDPPELHIHNIQKNGPYLLVINEQGPFKESELHYYFTCFKE